MFGSYFFSILLHLALVLLVFFWPASPPIKLDQPMMQISVNMGAPGGNRTASPVLGPQGKPTPTKAAPQPAPAEQQSSAVPVVREDIVQPKAEPKRESRPKPKPEPKKDAVALAEKKTPKKPEPEEEEETPKEKPKEKPKETPKEDDKKDKKDASKDEKKNDEKAKPAKPSDKKKDGVDPSKALADALADAKKKAGPRGSGNKSGKSSVAGALAEFQKNAGGAGGGGGGEGDGPGGGGIYDVYMGQVILAVRPNWSIPAYAGRNLAVQVNVKLDSSGKVLSCTIARSSGRAEVDASAVNAVLRAKQLPPPPTPEQQELIITFNTQDMGGR